MRKVGKSSPSEEGDRFKPPFLDPAPATSLSAIGYPRIASPSHFQRVSTSRWSGTPGTPG